MKKQIEILVEEVVENDQVMLSQNQVWNLLEFMENLIENDEDHEEYKKFENALSFTQNQAVEAEENEKSVMLAFEVEGEICRFIFPKGQKIIVVR